jgi:chromosome segregation protein
MKLTRLRITGFKSFVETTDFLIEPGLTGVVGPNGCGKSNLVEALRWVMGESSYKSLRASGMDDVIFSGTGSRPARNMAEVMLTLDNADRKAPAAFNDAEMLEVTRRIERDDGSVYRMNGREVRARDVQLLFADAATGARSPAMVRQGQISEIINAKPSARRRILEDAAGIAGLYGRRHEAELRLKGAEDNLTRLDDVLKQIDSQIDGLKRQSRQAQRYKALSAEIRQAEAVIALGTWRDARVQVAHAEQQAAADIDALTRLGLTQAETAKNQAVAAEALPKFREAETVAAAVLQRLLVARETLQSDEERARQRLTELERRLAEMQRDLERENLLLADAGRAIATLDAEESALVGALEATQLANTDAATRLSEREAALQIAEAALTKAQSELTELLTRQTSIDATIRSENDRLGRLRLDLAKTELDLDIIRAAIDSDLEIRMITAEYDEATAALSSAEAQAEAARQTLLKARDTENASRRPLEDAERQAQRLETEIRTLTKLLSSGDSKQWPSLLDQLTVSKGMEAALGAALGDDLEASVDPEAPAHWSNPGAHAADPALPEGAHPLKQSVKAPPALDRRLNQTGLVTRDVGENLRSQLKPGQVLVSKEGDIWRWDGFTAKADAPTPAARRLAEKNRLGELELEAKDARAAADALKQVYEQASEAVKLAVEAEGKALALVRATRQTVDALRDKRLGAERRQNEQVTRRSALEDAKARFDREITESDARLANSTALKSALPNSRHLETALDTARAETQLLRTAVAEAAATVKSLTREIDLRTQRRSAISREKSGWVERKARASAQNAEFTQRRADIEAERTTLIETPGIFAERRRALNLEIEAATASRQAKADALAEAETTLATTDREARKALAQFMTAREDKVKSELRLENAKETLGKAIATIRERFEESAEELANRLNAQSEETDATLHRLDHLKSERERLGAVNLRADEELNEIEERKTALSTEQNELVEAIRRLRSAIGSLNREGRERLLAAFEEVKTHFERLFVSLFGGGTARLELIESDDPLEAGLEILAHPPGKKPSTMSLLSGGEQALTAIALIFAVFLTNPSPVCVLDEVDAPLDDANVERYCDLLNDMARTTETRFIVITHNPITMARMDRLFGVTMAERGVSQLVSVDLGMAEGFLQAS